MQIEKNKSYNGVASILEMHCKKPVVYFTLKKFVLHEK